MFFRVLADTDSSLQYYSKVGVNTFVTVQLSFLPESEVRSTRVAAKSFCPEFEHHAEFCCNLLVQRDSGESISLAELMQDAVAIFTIYNKDTRKSEFLMVQSYIRGYQMALFLPLEYENTLLLPYCSGQHTI